MEGGWKQLWQMPALLLGLMLFVGGIVMVIRDRKLPDYGSYIQQAQQLLNDLDLESAEKVLDEVGNVVETLSPELQSQYALLRGDLVYRTDRKHDWNNPTNLQMVVDLYEKAESLGQKLDEEHQAAMGHSLIGLRKYDQGLKRLDGTQNHQPDVELLSKVLQRLVDQPQATLASVRPLMDRLSQELDKQKDPASRRAREIWLARLQAQYRLRDEPAERVLPGLLQTTVRLADQGGDQDLASLYWLLAKGYQGLKEDARARDYFVLARDRVRSTEPQAEEIKAQSLVGVGQTLLSLAGAKPSLKVLEQALDQFTKADTEYRSASAHMPALMGRADCQARLGQHDIALDYYDQAIHELAKDENDPAAAAKLETVIKQILAQVQSALNGNQLELAQRYVDVWDRLYREKERSADILLPLAQIHDRLARKKIKEAQQAGPHDALGQKLAVEAGKELEQAGDLYVEHSGRMVASDVLAYANSLWLAGDAYEECRHWKKAIDVLGQINRTLPGDPRLPEALLRLGLAYMADGQYTPAVDLFKRLVDQHAQTPSAYGSYVPLARCYVVAGQINDAKRILRYVVTDHPALGPQSQEYRQALIELGQLLVRQGEYEAALTKLEEAVQRYGQGSAGLSLQFQLAETYRQSIGAIDQSLSQDQVSSAPGRQQALSAERIRRLETAQKLYGQVIQIAENRADRHLEELERIYYRNAYFYRADCAYDLGRLGLKDRFEQAVLLYDLAARRFDQEPSSMMALAQIVNIYCELGRFPQAKVANDRAREQLRRLPENAFDAPNLPMNREHWDQWLQWAAKLNFFDSKSPPSPPSPSPSSAPSNPASTSAAPRSAAR